MTVSLSREEEIIGTAGSVKRLGKHFDDTFIVIMDDALTDIDVGKIVAFQKRRKRSRL